jgi:hypothetical protein
MTIPATTPADGELLPCPFCGSSVKIKKYTEILGIVCEQDKGCEGSGLGVAFLPQDQEKAIAAWNVRSASSVDESANLHKKPVDDSGEMHKQSDTPPPQSPIGWYEAEPSCAGADLRALLHGLGPMTHSGRMHWQSDRPSTTNPVWPIYATPSPGKAEAERCWCRTCRPITMRDMRMVLCPTCGNKRCPHANDHRNTCTGSNEMGQPGSAYPGARFAPALTQPDESDHLLVLLAEIRAAAGDNGERMQSELVPFIAGLARDAGRYRWWRRWLFAGHTTETGMELSGARDEAHLDAAIDAAIQARDKQ